MSDTEDYGWNYPEQDEEWRKATCEECAWAMDMKTCYPLCRKFHIDVLCNAPACPAFVRR